MKTAVTGASGLIGSALVPALRAQGHDVLRLVRREPVAPDEVSWDPAARRLDPAALADVDAVVHLAGVGVADRRWSAARKAAVLDSRVDGTTTVSTALAAATRADARPRTLLSASAVGWYGDTGDRLTDESGTRGAGFLADVCVAWEAATGPAQDAGVRVAHLRTGIVLAPEGGALAAQVRVFRLGLGAPLGSGRQWVPWISLDDDLAAVLHLLGSRVRGPVNLVAPEPVTNRDFTKALGRAVRRPTLPVPVPGAALRLLLGDFADEGVLAGQRLAPRVLLGDGFAFGDTQVGPTLERLLRR